MTLQVGEQVGPFRLLGPIGRGGMAAVYAARHDSMDRDVALKLLHPARAGEPEVAARFLQEARTLARLEHPGVVRVLHSDRLKDGTVYLAMELLDGVSLRAWLDERENPPDLATVRSIARQVAEAMEYVHGHDIVHRDLKPENVVLQDGADSDDDWRATIVDFGIAKVPPKAPSDLAAPPADTQIETRGPVLLGTATYMAPEQCRDAAEVSDRTDVYALGVMLYEMLTGAPPFSGDPIDVIASHIQEPAPPLGERTPGLPTALDVLVASMLDKQPARRPTMRRVREMLARPWDMAPEAERGCPFPGLLAFAENDAEMFFGRDDAVATVLDHLDRARGDGPRHIVIEGASGVGKSSLLHAGVLPALRDRASPAAPLWRVVRLRPSDPFGDAIADLARAVGHEAMTQALLDDPGALPHLLATHAPPGQFVLLAIDPLDELLTSPATHTRPLTTMLASALAEPTAPMCILATARSDLARRGERDDAVAALLRTSACVTVRPMTKPELTEIIRGMCERTGCQLADGLAERLAREAAATRDPLLLLGHTLRSLWPASGRSITHEHYDALGGVAGALAEQAERVLDGLGEDGRVRARWMVMTLVQVGRGTPDTRVPRTESEVLNAAGDDALAREVLHRLASRVGATTGRSDRNNLGLLTVAARDSDGDARVELVHDTLLHEVPTIARWIDSERTRLERHADLEAIADTWERSQRPRHGLPSGTLLSHFTGAEPDDQQRVIFDRLASDRSRAFIDASRALEKRRKYAWRSAAVALVVALLAVALSAWNAGRERERAEQQRAKAETARIHAERERERAEGNLEEFLRAVDGIVSSIDWKLSRLHGTLLIRRGFLEQIIKSLDALPAMDRARAVVREIVIKAYHRLGDLHRHDGALERASELYGQADQEIGDALKQSPGDDRFLRMWAMSHSKHGKLSLACADHDQARMHFDAALKWLKPRFDASDKDARRTLATSYSEKADLAMAEKRPGPANALYSHALDLLPDGGDYDTSLRALTLALRARAKLQLGDRDSAAADLQQALALQRPITEGNRQNAYYRWTLGRILLGLGEHSQSLDDYRAAYRLGRALHDNDPDHKRYALLLCESLAGLERVAMQTDPATPADARLVNERCEVAGRMATKDPADRRFVRFRCR